MLAIASFCVFGFLASFEPGNGLMWQLGYGALGIGCLTGAVACLFRPLGLTVAALALLAIALFCIFGFMESYLSYPGEVVYGALGCCCLVGAVALLGRNRNRANRPLA
jgi:hypothetical protein